MRCTVVACAASLCLLSAALAGPADAAMRRATNIPAESLSEALRTLAKDRQFEILYRAEVVRDVRTGGAVGEFTPEEALKQLLLGTGLSYKYLDTNTVTVFSQAQGPDPAVSGVAPHDANDPSNKEGSGKNSSHDFRVAQVDQTNAGPQVRQGTTSAAKQEGTALEGTALEEITVTAQKREERLQNVPISISVLGGVDLDKSSFAGALDALSTVPGVSTTAYAQGGGTQIQIRGVSASGPIFNGSSPIAYYLDSVPFGLIKSAIVPDADVYDLNRIEVLRGPQGTLYGASALNGVVRVLTMDPDLSEFDLKARVAGSSTEYGAGNYRGDVAVNVPLIDGALAARAVVGDEHWSGWINSPDKTHINDSDIRNYRLKLDGKPTDDLTIGISAWRSTDDQGAPSAGQPNRTIAASNPEPIATDFDTYDLTIAWDLPAFSVSSKSSYLDYKVDSSLDVGVPFATNFKTRVLSEEFLVNSQSGSSWRWTAGAFYRDGKDRLVQTAAFLPAPIDYYDTSKSVAVFGELGQRFLNDQLGWTLGLRYFHDNVGTGENVQDQGLVGVPLYGAKDSFNSTTPRAVLTWYPDNNLTVYGSYSQGFRSGFAQNANIIEKDPNFPSVKPDKLSNYELGAKGTLWDRRISFDTAVYFIDWKDVQQTLEVPIGFGTLEISAPVNGQSASGPGFDLSMAANLLEGLQLGINFGWSGLKLNGNVYSGGVVLFKDGERLNLSPEYTAGAWLNYGFPFGGSGYGGRFSLSANYTSEQSNHAIAPPGTSVVAQIGSPILISRASFAIHSPTRWTATLFVDNLNNEQHSPFILTATDHDYDSRVRPRTVGLQLEYHLK